MQIAEVEPVVVVLVPVVPVVVPVPVPVVLVPVPVVPVSVVVVPVVLGDGSGRGGGRGRPRAEVLVGGHLPGLEGIVLGRAPDPVRLLSRLRLELVPWLGLPPPLDLLQP